MTKAWKKYQEEAAAFFRSLGLDASTDEKVQGVRTTHDVDVLVKSHHVGFDITWLVECKYWKTKVSKLHVLALREIVSDVGADRGILLAETGFQSGAIEAATLTNVQVTSLAEVSETASNAIYSMRLRELYDRVENCKKRYWDIPKRKRIECGLRPDLCEDGYMGDLVIDLCNDLLSRSFRGTYPFSSDNLLLFEKQNRFNSICEVIAVVEPLVDELEAKLRICEDS